MALQEDAHDNLTIKFDREKGGKELVGFILVLFLMRIWRLCTSRHFTYPSISYESPTPSHQRLSEAIGYRISLEEFSLELFVQLAHGQLIS